jgi:hypothetical protein
MSEDDRYKCIGEYTKESDITEREILLSCHKYSLRRKVELAFILSHDLHQEEDDEKVLLLNKLNGTQ